MDKEIEEKKEVQNENIIEGKSCKIPDMWKIIVLVSVLLIMVIALLIGYFTKSNANDEVNTQITFDVNPSITLSLNNNNYVVDYEALNDDGAVILENLDVIDLSAEEATEKIVDAMIENGYLEGDGANILLTIQNNDLSLAEDIESSLTDIVNDKLEEEYIAGTVLTQVDTIRTDIPSEIQGLMDTYDISYSKAVFISNILKQDSAIDVAELANLSISQISLVVHNKNISLENVVSYANGADLCKSEAVEQLRKAKDESLKLQKQAEDEASSLQQEIQTKTQAGEDTTSAQNAYEEAEQERLQAIDKASDDESAYQEAVQNKNQNTDNGSSTDSGNSSDNGSSSGSSSENSNSSNKNN